MKFTVFTPVYNRAYCINNLYQSLKGQTYKNFEWIVIDDGSTDNVGEIIKKWIDDENDFPIIYARVKNGGKMRAVNKGVRLSTAPAFFIVDSDDTLTENAMELLNTWFQVIENNKRFAGVSGLKQISTVPVKYDFEYVDATNLERRIYNLSPDMAECYKTEILRQHLAPEIDGENYISPSIVWNQIAKEGYKLRWYNKYIYKAEYQEDGLSRQGYVNLRKKNPIGWGKLISLNIECKGDVDYKEFQWYWYYQNLRDELSIDKIADYLNIRKIDLQELIDKKPRIVRYINKYFHEHEIKSVGLYGLGSNAKKFLSLRDVWDVEIRYGIDRLPNSLVEPCYCPSDRLPNADCILITNMFGSEEIKTELKRSHNEIKCISLENDILEKSMSYYFSEI